MNLAVHLLAQARSRPDQPALIRTQTGRDEVVTFAELADRSARVAALLRTLGVNQADRVLLLVPMSADLYAALSAVLRIGAVATLIDPSAGLAHLRSACALARPRALIAVSRAQWLRALCGPLRGIPLKVTIGRRWLPAHSWSEADRLSPEGPPMDLPPDAPALLTFTSGSTGRPKAAVRTHALLDAQRRAVIAALDLHPGSVDLTTLPVFVLANLAAGVTSLLPDADLRRPGAITPAPLIEQIRRHRPHSIIASPSLLQRVAAACHSGAERLDSLSRVFTGGAPVFWHALDALRSLAPDARVVALYGSTEAEPIAEVGLDMLTPGDRDRTRAGGGLPAGRPTPETQVRIIPDQCGRPIPPTSPDEFARLSLPPGQIGEIVVTGPHVLKGYLDPAHDAESKFTVGSTVWHRTGDSGHLDDSGLLWLTGRCAGRISDDHGVIYPLQVEAAAHLIAPLRRAALVPLRGRRVLVVEADAADLDSEGLIRGLPFARLSEVRRVDRIPVDRRHNAKIDYAALKDSLAGLRG